MLKISANKYLTKNRQKTLSLIALYFVGAILSASVSFAQGIHIEGVSDKEDRELFVSSFYSSEDLYFVDLLTKTCTRRNLTRRTRDLEFRTGVLKEVVKFGDLNCGVEILSTMSAKAVFQDRTVGWFFEAKEDFCLSPAVNAAAVLFGMCNVVGCRLNVPKGTNLTFITPVRDLAASVYENTVVPSQIETLRGESSTINLDYSSEITRRCPPERF